MIFPQFENFDNEDSDPGSKEKDGGNKDGANENANANANANAKVNAKANKIGADSSHTGPDRLAARIQIESGDITHLSVDAVVTAANEQLCGGAGVDGAIHYAAGPELVAASMALAPCPAGQARITPAFNMHVQHVIHAVGPIFYELEQDSIRLASTYRWSLKLAAENEIATIAFPCISTGVYGFPKSDACKVAFATAIEWLQENAFPKVVTFCCYEEVDAQLYRERYDDLFGL